MEGKAFQSSTIISGVGILHSINVNGNMNIRSIRKTEIKQAARIVGQNYSKSFEKSAYKEIQAAFQSYVIQPHYLVAEEKGEVVGSTLVQKVIEIIKRKDAKMILLVTDKPRFYAKRFKFKTLAEFDCDPYQLMALRLKK